MSTSGAGSGHHRTFARPNSSLARFSSSHQSSPQDQSPLQGHPSYHFSSLPTGAGPSSLGSFSRSGGGGRLQRHQSFIQQSRGGLGGSLDTATADYIRSIELVKDEENPSFGFNIKGGTDYGEWG